MLIRTHLAFGVMLYLLIFEYIQKPALFLIGILIGVFIVDLDSKKSTVGKNVLLRPLQFFIRHRGITHSIFFGGLVFAIFSAIESNVAIGFLIGFMSHLFLDCLTPRGVAIFWPLSDYKFSFKIKTGSTFEDILFVVFLFIDLALFVRLII